MSNITKKDICSAIADSTGLTRVDTQIIVESLFEAIRNTMLDGHNIELRGFGRFKTKPKPAHRKRNPITGEPVQVPAGFKLVFQASKELRARVNKKIAENRGDGPGT